MLNLENHHPAAKGVRTINLLTGEEKSFTADGVLLATGHSATDIYMMLARTAPDCLEAKTFAAGVRVEHPRTLIDAIQYHGQLNNGLGAAEYRVTTQVKDRGVYSFCMCPGGEVVAAGSLEDIIKEPRSITGQYLSGKKKIYIPDTRRKGNGKVLTIKGAQCNNLKKINVDFPLGKFICVTGVSGSGKSSLINQTLYPALKRYLQDDTDIIVGKHKEIVGLNYIDKVVNVTQEPIGKTPRSNPATYVGVFDDIRDLFAETIDSRSRGYDKGRFSFNVPGGRCEHCGGAGVISIPMNFLPSVYVKCEECEGRRYNEETLQVTYKGKNIYEVLEMTVEEACKFFENRPKIKHKVQILSDVGLGYIKLGQQATTLSGGEAQRVKLAYELQKRPTGKSIFILDEPTTGLHMDDVNRLIGVLQRIVDNGDTVVVIEHNLDVIKVADYIIDIGPEGGDKGGTIVATGTPEEVANNAKSYTGHYLKDILKKR